MEKSLPFFETKTTQKPYPFGLTYYLDIAHIEEFPFHGVIAQLVEYR